ncbi:DUF6480 family protein [Streptomyces sp. URMC 123]|uniref:DUF6480 family protein n=1 Tax=Streptomyces sp. URMC 123 TaxID=3423403 RepID=UPI003F1DFA3E
MTTNHPEPEPEPEPHDTPRVEPGPVPPSETPEGEDSTSGAGPRETYNPTKGWAKGPLFLILLVVALCAAFFLAYAVTLML